MYCRIVDIMHYYVIIKNMLQLDLCFKVDNNEHLHYFAFLVLNALKAATTNMYSQSDWKAMIRVIPQ